jgi:SHS2 domain-containing protein
MKPFELLDHTADLKIRAYGKTIEEAFGNSALGMYSYITDVARIKTKKNIDVKISSKQMRSLLYDFLEQLLFLTDTENLIFGKIEKMKISKTKEGFSLSCVASGDSFEKYETHGDIKSITYSEMDIDEKSVIKCVQFVVDI